MMFDHPLQGPGQRALQRAEAVVDTRQWSLWGGGPVCRLLAAGHVQPDLALDDEGVDFRRAEGGAEAVDNDHGRLVSLSNCLVSRI
jgi:hypothetical protein